RIRAKHGICSKMVHVAQAVPLKLRWKRSERRCRCPKTMKRLCSRWRRDGNRTVAGRRWSEMAEWPSPSSRIEHKTKKARSRKKHGCQPAIAGGSEYDADATNKARAQRVSFRGDRRTGLRRPTRPSARSDPQAGHRHIRHSYREAHGAVSRICITNEAVRCGCSRRVHLHGLAADPHQIEDAAAA